MFIYQEGTQLMVDHKKLQSNKKPKILLVEDNAMNTKVATLLLGECGCHDITAASTGLKALEIFAMDAFDLIILDIGLPDIKGTEVCKILRTHYAQSTLPIIACTALGEHIKKECLEVGITDFLFKPITLKNVEAIVKKYLIKQPEIIH